MTELPTETSLAVLIRTVGERTLEWSRRLVVDQAPGVFVGIVNERPHELMLRRCCELGIDIGAKWTVAMDADVLLRTGAIAALVTEAEDMPANYVHLEGRVYDKVFGVYRHAGGGIYRTALLPQALECIPPPGQELRPERALLTRLWELGHASRRTGTVLGLHDYHQFYRDLYRKAFLHANKHVEYLPEIIARCRLTIREDDDFRVLLRGLGDGVASTSPVRVDAGAFPQDLGAVLDELGLTEKAALDMRHVGEEEVESILSALPPPDERPYHDISEHRFVAVPPANPPPSSGAERLTRRLAGSSNAIRRLAGK